MTLSSLLRHALTFLLTAAWAAAAQAGGACSAQSPNHSVALIELYTSEGCSSCPPADRWLSRLGKGYPADRVIPLAFHVDYWNYLGWSDRFSTPEFTERQKDQALRQRSKLVYTPQVFVDSHDFRGWRDAGSLRKEVERINAHPPTVRLALAAEGAGNGKLTVQVQASPLPKSSGATPPVYLALYETGLESQVTAGENKDVHLRHDFVVRELLGPFASDAAGTLTTQRTLELPADLNPAHAGLVAFTDSDRADGSRQALALALDHCLSDK